MTYGSPGGTYGIYVINPDGTGGMRLTNHDAWDDEPAWSPDGRRIAFTSTRGGSGADLYIMNADGTNVMRLTTRAAVRQPTWSPDGLFIAFGQAPQCDRSTDICVYPRPWYWMVA